MKFCRVATKINVATKTIMKPEKSFGCHEDLQKSRIHLSTHGGLNKIAEKFENHRKFHLNKRLRGASKAQRNQMKQSTSEDHKKFHEATNNFTHS